MPAGRPPMGTGLVDRLEGSEEAKAKWKAILGTMTGEVSVAEACERLGISETRLYQLREESMRGAVETLEPAAKGRPAKPEPEAESEAEGLRKRVKRLEIENELLKGRVLGTLAFPNLVKYRDPEKKKSVTGGESREERRRRRKAERRNRGKS